jgi:hypothetical protein
MAGCCECGDEPSGCGATELPLHHGKFLKNTYYYMHVVILYVTENYRDFLGISLMTKL